MALDTFIKFENSPGSLIDFSFIKIQRQTKAIIVNMLRNFFDAYNQEYRLQVPELAENQNSAKRVKLFIERDFPYNERKLPIVVVSIKNAKERKMYLGADNYIGHHVIETSSGTFASPMYTGSATISLSLVIATNSAEERAKLVEMISFCFTHYYRWQYFYSLGDGNTFSVVPNTEELDFGSESEIKDDASTMTFVYTTDIAMKAYVEYTWVDVKTDSGYITHYEIDSDSGPVEFMV